MMLRLCNQEKGFTLVEILIVVLIIGILAAIAIPNLLSARSTAWQQTCAANRTTLQAAAQLFMLQSGAFPADQLAMTTAVTGYPAAVLPKVYNCPATNSNTYGIQTDGTWLCTNTGGAHP